MNDSPQHKSCTPISEAQRTTTGSAQWLLEACEDEKTPPYHANELQLFICGEVAFEQIAKDIKKAKESVEIICWGFDPAMELIRTKNTWPRGLTWGDLLKEVAEGKHNGGKPVQVRLLSWYGFIGSTLLGGNNMPGYSKDDTTTAQRASPAFNPDDWTDGIAVTPQDQRKDFNAQWYQDAFGGRLKNLTIRIRDGDEKAVSANLANEPGKRGYTETKAMVKVATDHQKTILIDYEHEGGASAVGYVMGLNSVTDYWDTAAHLFKDPRRGASWEGAGDDGPGLKPYQDYACRIRGAALVAVSKNFTDAWNRAKGRTAVGTLARTHDLKNPPKGLTRTLVGATQRAQIVRTQPEEQDQTIKRLYRQASSFARNYLFVENQYFQYTDWARQLKGDRAAYVDGWRKGGRHQGDLPNLHLMAIIPTPEKGFMVPRTHDTVKALGHGTSVPNQDKAVEDELRLYDLDMARYEKLKAIHDKNPLLFPNPPTKPELSDIAETSRMMGDKSNLSRQLDAIGLRTLVASLWTHDPGWSKSKHSVFQRQQREQEIYQRDLKIYQQSKAGYEEAMKRALAAGGRPYWGYTGPSEPKPPTDRRLQVASAVSEGYREIYIHSKLMIIDDAMFTLGSANLNLRSMAVDAEINIASDDVGKSRDLRRRVWGLHTGNAEACDGGDGSPSAVQATFKSWQALMTMNEVEMKAGRPITGFLVPFHDERKSRIRLG